MKLAYCKEAATAADCKRMLSKENAASVQAADAQMSTWRRLIEALPDGAKKLSSSNVQTALSLGDMSLAAYALSLNIPGEDLKRYQCKEALAHDVVLILQGVLSCSIPSPWLAHATEPEKDTETDSQKGVKLMRELNEDGSVKDSAFCSMRLASSLTSLDHGSDGKQTWSLATSQLCRMARSP